MQRRAVESEALWLVNQPCMTGKGLRSEGWVIGEITGPTFSG